MRESVIIVGNIAGVVRDLFIPPTFQTLILSTILWNCKPTDKISSASSHQNGANAGNIVIVDSDKTGSDPIFVLTLVDAFAIADSLNWRTELCRKLK